MAIVTINDENLINIATAIREKNGETTVYKPSEMAAAISAISGGGESGRCSVLSGDLSQVFSCEYLTSTATAAKTQYEKMMTSFIGAVANTMAVSNAQKMFYQNTYITEIPFAINVEDNANVSSCFSGAINLTKCPEITGKIGNSSSLFYECNSLQDASALETVEFNDPIGTATTARGNCFYNCYRVREIPSNFLKQLGQGQGYSSSAYCPYYYTFINCYGLNKIENLGVSQFRHTSGRFTNTFANTYMLSKVTFETNEDGTPIEVQWYSQTINLSSYVGYANNTSAMPTYVPECTSDKQINSASTYEALKNDPDAWTANAAYSKYNHDSALETIKSLPDTSAFLAENSGKTNTIKFNGTAGSATDGGAINTLTTAEIAIATAKGWTVTLS